MTDKINQRPNPELEPEGNEDNPEPNPDRLKEDETQATVTPDVVPGKRGPKANPAKKGQEPAAPANAQTASPVDNRNAPATESVDDKVSRMVREQLAALGINTIPTPPPAEPEPTPEDTFREVLWLAGNQDVTVQPAFMLPGNRNIFRFNEGFFTFIGDKGEQQYQYVMERYGHLVYKPQWNDEDGPWPQCPECGWRVPNIRAFTAHMGLHPDRAAQPR